MYIKSFVLNKSGWTNIELPGDHTLLNVVKFEATDDMDGELVELVFMYPSNQKSGIIHRKFWTFPTNQEMPIGRYNYIGSVSTKLQPWHVFEEINK